MKTAILSYGHFDYIFPIARELAKTDEVCIYLMVHGSHFTESVCNFKLDAVKEGLLDEESTRKMLDKEINEYLGNNLKIKLFKYPSLRTHHFKNYLLSLKLALHLRAEKFQVVHFNGIKFFQFVINFFLGKGKSIWTIHDPFLHSGEEQKDTVVLYRYLARKRFPIILLNKHYRDQYIEKYGNLPERVFFLPFGPFESYRAYQQKGIETTPYSVLFYGRISKYKGLEYLIEAGKIAKSQIQNLKIVIAGKGMHQIDFESLSSDPAFEIHNRYIPNAELVQFIQKAAVIACPYTDATQSGVIMTAVALGKPVIASAVGGIPEAVFDHETGILVKPKDAQALAEALIEFFSDPDSTKKYGQKIEKYYFSGDLSQKNLSQKLLSIYKLI